MLRNRAAFQRLCEKACATTSSSVSANTDLLITGADVGVGELTKTEKLCPTLVDDHRLCHIFVQ
jgi:DNA ligase (NAD+)